MRIDLKNGDKFLSTLEFADITNEMKDLLEINKEIGVYATEDELRLDLAIGYLDKALQNDTNKDLKIGFLFNLRQKMLHHKGECQDDCIYCNPDLGDDPFPNFTFQAKFLDPSGSA